MNTCSGKPSAVISPEEFSKSPQQFIVLDCRPFDDYDFCHLDGAIHVDIDSVLSSAADPEHDPAKGGRNPLPKIEVWEKQLQKWGVNPETTILAYDDAAAAEGAARAWWMLTASGLKAGVLDGGWEAIVKAKLPINEEVPEPKPSAFKFTEWLFPMVDIETVDKLRHESDWLLIDSRAPERWRGEVEKIDPIAGHIPGSKNIFFKSNLDNTFFKKTEELRKMYMEILGDIPPARTIASCGSGMTACHTLLALYQAGLEGASLYVGSFSEWCRNKQDIV